MTMAWRRARVTCRAMGSSADHRASRGMVSSRHKWHTTILVDHCKASGDRLKVTHVGCSEPAAKRPGRAPREYAMLIHRGPAVSCRSRDPRDRAQALRDGPRSADRLAARPYRSALVRGERSRFPIRRRCSSCPTTTSSACSTARACRSRTSASPRKRRRRRSRRDAREIWRLFAEHYHLFRGTPTRLLARPRLRDAVRLRRSGSRPRTPTAITTASPRPCATPEFRPRALFERFNIEVDRHDREPARSA